MKTLLIIDDNQETCQAVKLFMDFEGFHCVDFSSGTPALEMLEKETVHAVLLDLNLGQDQMSGMEVLAKIKKLDPLLPVIILTGDSTVKAAVQAIKSGAYHYLTKPFDNEEMTILVKKAIEESEKSRQMEILKARMVMPRVPSIVGNSPAVTATLQMVERIAPTELTVVIEGESGSGKELFARLIHSRSLRKDGPFVSLDCGTFQETLAESELFGYEKGAFTGADKRKYGQFEIASGGTIFLDEIGNLPPAIQAKLLRVLQERKVQHLGGHKEIEVDVRVMVASNKNLELMTREGKFREDLFHRLNQITLSVPPLRKRIDDVPELAAYFLKNANQEMHKSVENFSIDAIRLMKNYSWPGNVRELKNAVYRAALLADKEIKPEHLQISLTRDKLVEKSISDSAAGKKVSLKKATRHATQVLEKQLIEQTLRKCNHNKTLAAKRLKIDRKALYNKLKKYKLLRK